MGHPNSFERSSGFGGIIWLKSLDRVEELAQDLGARPGDGGAWGAVVGAGLADFASVGLEVDNAR
jgi:hypothetical protein